MNYVNNITSTFNRLWCRSIRENEPYHFTATNFKQNSFTVKLTYNTQKGFEVSLSENNAPVCAGVKIEADFLKKRWTSFSRAELARLDGDININYSVEIQKKPDHSFQVVFVNQKSGNWICCTSRKRLKVDAPLVKPTAQNLPGSVEKAQSIQQKVVPSHLPEAPNLPAFLDLKEDLEQTPVQQVVNPLPTAAALIEDQDIEELKAYMRQEIEKHKVSVPLVPRTCSSGLSFEDSMDLDATINAFLDCPTDEKSALCLFGDAGIGKSTYCWNKAEQMLNSRKAGDPLPIVIDCLDVKEFDELVDDVFEKIEFFKRDVHKRPRNQTKETRSFVFFFLNCDGAGVLPVTNQYSKGQLNQWGGYKGKSISTCCPQSISKANINVYFAPKSSPHISNVDLFEAIYMRPMTQADVEKHFQNKTQHLKYIQQTPALKNLVLNPFFLKAVEDVLDTFPSEKLALEASKDTINSIYDKILDKWLMRHIQKLLQAKHEFVEKDLKEKVLDFCMKIAPEMKANDGSLCIPKSKFHPSTPAQNLLKAERLLLSLSPFGKNAEDAFVFLDPAFLDYFVELGSQKGVTLSENDSVERLDSKEEDSE